MHLGRDSRGDKSSKQGSSDENLALVSKTRMGRRKSSSMKGNNDVGKKIIMWITFQQEY